MSEGITQIQKPTPEQPKPKEKLSDEEMGNLLSSVGNNEAKAITLILMRNGSPYEAGNLHAQVIGSQGEHKAWIMNRSVPFSYCSKSFAPIGLVAKETLSHDLSAFGYLITEKGRKLGIPLAGLMLDFSERHNVSLSQLFGATVSSSELEIAQTREGENIEFRKRAPITTLKILYELLTSQTLPIKDADLKDKIGSAGINGHLSRLSRLGLIQHDTREANGSFSRYKLRSVIPEGELPIYANQRVLTEQVLSIVKNNPGQYFTTEDILGLLPQEQKEKWGEENARRKISSVLSFLAKRNYLDAEKFNRLRQTETTITDKQKLVLTELLGIIDKVQNMDQDILQKGERLGGEIVSNPNRVASLMKRAREASGNANASSSEDVRGMIASLISSHPDGITNKDIQILLEQIYGKKLGISRIGALSSHLSDQGMVGVKKTGSVSRFYPGS